MNGKQVKKWFKNNLDKDSCWVITRVILKEHPTYRIQVAAQPWYGGFVSIVGVCLIIETQKVYIKSKNIKTLLPAVLTSVSTLKQGSNL